MEEKTVLVYKGIGPGLPGHAIINGHEVSRGDVIEVPASEVPGLLKAGFVTKKAPRPKKPKEA